MGLTTVQRYCAACDSVGGEASVIFTTREAAWYIHCVQENITRKQETKTFFVISPTKLRRFWWNFLHRFPNKCASKWCKGFPPHL